MVITHSIRKSDVSKGAVLSTLQFPLTFLFCLCASAVKRISDLRLAPVLSKIAGISGLCALLLVLCLSAEAQQPKKVPRIGYLSTNGDPSNPPPFVEVFRQGLRDL